MAETKKNSTTENTQTNSRETRLDVLGAILKKGTKAEKDAVMKLVNSRKLMNELVKAVTECCKQKDKIEAIKSKILDEGFFTVEQLDDVITDTEKKYKEKKEKKAGEAKK